MAFCRNCGKPLNEGAVFCANCGAAVGAATSASTGTTYSEPTGAAGTSNGYQNHGGTPTGTSNMNQTNGGTFTGSTWNGTVFETFVNSLAVSLIIGLTCGIATPWAVCYMTKFIVENAIIDGKRYTFDGTGAQLFGNWIKWFLLTIITCGIYSFWVAPRLYRWVASHIHAVG